MNQIGVIHGIERKIGVWSDRLTETESDLAAQEAIIAASFAKQAELDTKTSIMQIPALFKHKAVKFGDVNIDIGGGRFDLATNYLASIGTTVSKKAAHRCGLLFGDPYGNRTHVTAVKGRCLNRLTNGPYKKGAGLLRLNLVAAPGFEPGTLRV